MFVPFILPSVVANTNGKFGYSGVRAYICTGIYMVRDFGKNVPVYIWDFVRVFHYRAYGHIYGFGKF